MHKAFEIGITMVHLHARDGKIGLPTSDAMVYDRIISGIRRFTKDLIICTTTSSRNFPEFEKRSEVLELSRNVKPDMASLKELLDSHLIKFFAWIIKLVIFTKITFSVNY